MIRKILSSALCLIMLFVTLAFGGTVASAEDGIVCSVGDIIEFGTYPQSDVTDALGDILGLLDGEWISYNYYSGTGNWDDGQMKPSDYMRYKDVVYNGEKYRGVIFDSYRPACAGYTSLSNEQQFNGYCAGNVYWFRYEPIKWRVLDPSAGLIMCDSIIDSQAYNNYVLSSGTDGHGWIAYWGDSAKTYYASNYAKSGIRQWLNEDFYNTAFSDEQKADIKTAALNNDCWYTLNGDTGYEEYDAPSTNDKIFLLSYDEVINSDYGFDPSYTIYDMARRLKGSDYAKSQGLRVYTSPGDERDGNSWWWLRSPDYSYYASGVGYIGYAHYYNNVSYTYRGVVPALKLHDIKADMSIEKTIISIKNYVANKTVDYKTTITFSADVNNPVEGAEIRWFVNEKESGAGDTCTVTKAKESFTVQVKYIKEGKVLAGSGVEFVNVKAGFFAKLAAFFRSVFGALPKVVQGFMGA